MKPRTFETIKEDLVFNRSRSNYSFLQFFALAVMDLNGDGSDDLITGGNLERTRARTGLQKGNNGFIFLGNNKGDFQFVSPAATGINITDDVRRIVTDAGRVFFVTNNNSVRGFRPANKDSGTE